MMMLVGATLGDVVPAPWPRVEAPEAHAPMFDDLCANYNSSVPVAKATTREAGGRMDHARSAGMPRFLVAIVRWSVVGLVGRRIRGVSTLRRMVDGAAWADVVPVSQRGGEALETHAPIYGNSCPANIGGFRVLIPPAVEMGAAFAIGVSVCGFICVFVFFWHHRSS